MRKQEIFKITTEGRDKGKTFVITEMSAFKAERWAYRALLLLAKSNVDIPAAVSGMQGLAHAGFSALQSIDFEEARPLLDEMWDCVQIAPDPRNPDIVRKLVMRENESDDIEELATIWQIRERVFKLHTDFFFNAKPSKKASG